MYFTTSWDDGHPLDEKLAAMLARHGATGTLYITPSHPAVPTPLDRTAILRLGQSMEIGAHTMTHRELPSLSPEDAEREIIDSKRWTEGMTDRPCTMFCYPKGKWTPAVRGAVERAGFRGARTTQVYRFASEDPFTLPVSLHVYPFPFRPIANRRFIDPLRSARRATRGMGIGLHHYRGWLPFAQALFRRARAAHQPWFHLFGHSWEVERYRQWEDLEQFLSFVAAFDDVEHVPNSRLV